MLKKWSKRLGKFLLVLLVLLTGAWWFENWRGARTWKAAQARAELAGLSLDVDDYRPAPVPDSENLLLNPDFLEEWNGAIKPELRSWRLMELPGTITHRTGRLDPSKGQTIDYRRFFEEEISTQEAEKRIAELTSEIRNRSSKLADLILSHPVHDLTSLEVPSPGNPIPSPHTYHYLKLANSLADHATFAMRQGKSEIAMRHLEARDRMVTAFKAGPMIKLIPSLSVRNQDHHLIWEGIRRHAWNDAQLERLDELMENQDPLKDLHHSIRYEALYMVHAVDFLDEAARAAEEFQATLGEGLGLDYKPSFKDRLLLKLYTGGPSGWNFQRKALAVDVALDFLDYRAAAPRDDFRYEKLKSSHHYTPFDSGGELFNTFLFLEQQCREQASRTRLALIGIAAELSYLEHGAYPDTLSDLALEFDVTDLTDPKRRALAYELDPNGRPIVRSLHHPDIRWQFSPDE